MPLHLQLVTVAVAVLYVLNAVVIAAVAAAALLLLLLLCSVSSCRFLLQASSFTGSHIRAGLLE
eukprot:2980710-Rhodomonas_salina.2